MKGFIYLIEIAVAAILMVIVLSVFFSIRVKQDWQSSDLVYAGNNILNSIKNNDVYIFNILNENLTPIEVSKPNNINYGLQVIGSPKSVVRVGCMEYCDYIESLLSKSYVNGRWINFSVDSFNINDGIPPFFDAVVLVNFTDYFGKKSKIDTYLDGGGVLIGINGTFGDKVSAEALAFQSIFNIYDPPASEIDSSVNYKNSIIGKTKNQNTIIIESQDFFEKYIRWNFVEINSTHWKAIWNIINNSLKSDLVSCFSKTRDCYSECVKNIHLKYFSEYDLKGICEYVINGNKVPVTNLTENILFSTSTIDVFQGSGEFFIIFPKGFKEGERAKFGFNSTIISTTTTVPFYPNQRAICRGGNGRIHVVWKYSSTVLKHARSDDGINWNEIDLDNSIQTKYSPSISCENNVLSVAYVSGSKILYRGSVDNGITWSDSQEVIADASQTESNVVIERRGQKIYIVYSNSSMGQCINFINSSDSGLTWGQKVKIACGAWVGGSIDLDYINPSLATEDIGTGRDLLHLAVVFRGIDMMESYNDIRYFNSSNAGESWSASPKIWSTSSILYTSIAVNSSRVFLAYPSNSKIYFLNSSNNGTTWSTPLDISNTPVGKFSTNPIVSLDNYSIANPIVLWQDSRYNTNNDILMRSYNGTDWETIMNVSSDNTGNSYPNAFWKSYKTIDVVWINKTAPNYNIIYQSQGWKYIPPPPQPPPVINTFVSYNPKEETIPKYFLGLGFDVGSTWNIWEELWDIRYGNDGSSYVNISKGAQSVTFKHEGQTFNLPNKPEFGFKVEKIWSTDSKVKIQSLNKTFEFIDFSEKNVRGLKKNITASSKYSTMTANNTAIWTSDFPWSDEYRTLVKSAILSRTDSWNAKEVSGKGEKTTVSSFISLCCDMPETAELYLTLWYEI